MAIQNPQIHHRRSIRLKGYDYSLEGAYFVTMVTRGRLCLFGEIGDVEMSTNQIGEIIKTVWLRLPKFFPIQHDVWVIMPNHLHGIIWIRNPGKGEASAKSSNEVNLLSSTDASPLHFAHGTQQRSLGAVIQNFKSVSTRRINQLLRSGEAFGEINVNGKIMPVANASSRQVWQRNYYDRIIRYEKELNRIREYIIENPRQWADDPENLCMSHNAFRDNP